MTMSEKLPAVRCGILVCRECESSLMVTWEEGIKFVVCPLPGCNASQEIPPVPLSFGSESRGFPDGRHHSLACTRPWDDHAHGYCPHERKA